MSYFISVGYWLGIQREGLTGNALNAVVGSLIMSRELADEILAWVALVAFLGILCFI